MTRRGELGHRLVVANPGPEIHDQLAEHLTRLGLDVMGRAPSGLEAVSRAIRHRPDLIVASVGLEGKLTGPSIARVLADNYGIPSIIVGASEGLFDRGPEPRPCEELRSPFGLDDLEEAVYGALKRPVRTRLTAPAPSRVADGPREHARQNGPPPAESVEKSGEATLLTVELDDGSPGTAAVRRPTERRETRSSSSSAVKAAEEERLRIAQELHDDLAQRLATHQVHTQLARTASDERRSEVLEELQAGLEETSELVRRVIRGLRPPSLCEMGLPAALRTDLQERVAATDVELVLEIDPMPESPPDRVQLCLYRIGQEAVNNAIRHADPDTIVVTLAEDGSFIELSVRDDGRGIEPGRVGAIGDHFGLVGMRERAGAVGGEFRLESAPGAGTVIRARVPRHG
jgi:signal transduction histidine kinase